MKIIIRRANKQDVSSILLLLEALHASAGFAECAEFDAESAQVFTERLLDAPNGEVLVAERGDELIGLSTFIVDSPYFNHATKVASGISFWVDPEYRKTGVGKALYNASEKLATKMGCKIITLGVMVDDEYLQAYHERNGFKRREVLFHKKITREV